MRSENDTAGADAGRSPRKQQALDLFSVLPARYTVAATVLSLGQDPRWRRAMLAALGGPPVLTARSRVLDVATGTGLVAAALVARTGCHVVALDQSPQMLAAARTRMARDPLLRSRVTIVQGEAERLPFDDGEFDALTFTYLLRYVDDPSATLRELARVLAPGGRMACMDFGLPGTRAARALWWLHTRAGLPVMGRLISPEWAGAGRFLGPSISDFHRRHPVGRLREYWRDAGMVDVNVRLLSLGSGLVMSGTRDGRTG